MTTNPDSASDPVIDPEKLKRFNFGVFSHLQGALTSAMIHLGDRLGLYGVLRDADAAMTTEQIAAAAHLQERWVREWAYNQAAAGIIVAETANGEERFSITAEAVAVLADSTHPAFGIGMFHQLPQTIAAIDRVAESFRTGIGYDSDSSGMEGAEGTERGFGPWNNTFLVPDVLPKMEGLTAKLTTGIDVIDIGCGAGGAVLLMARAFPNSRFRGYDISRFALERAAHNKAESGLTNVEFLDPRDSPMPTDHSVQFVTTFDCIHDMTRPQEMMAAIRSALADDGTWLLVDIKALDTYAENAAKNPMAALMYGTSVLGCMSSALSEPGGAGLGTLGLSMNKAAAMAAEAGFSRLEKLRVDHSVNAFYQIRS